MKRFITIVHISSILHLPSLRMNHMNLLEVSVHGWKYDEQTIWPGGLWRVTCPLPRPTVPQYMILIGNKRKAKGL